MRTAGAHDDRDGPAGQVVEPAVVDREMRAPDRVDAALPERPEDVDRLGQHLAPLGDRRPSRAGHVFVQPLAGADRQGKAVVAHHRDGRRRLGDDRRVIADDRAGEAGGDADLRDARGDRAEHAPGEGRMALGFEPGVKMVGDRDEVEAGLLCQTRVLDQRSGAVLLAHQLVPELGHEVLRRLRWVNSPGRRWFAGIGRFAGGTGACRASFGRHGPVLPPRRTAFDPADGGAAGQRPAGG